MLRGISRRTCSRGSWTAPVRCWSRWYSTGEGVPESAVPVNFKDTHSLKKTVFDYKSILSNLENHKESVRRRKFALEHDLDLFPIAMSLLKKLREQFRELLVQRAALQKISKTTFQKRNGNSNQENDNGDKLSTESRSNNLFAQLRDIKSECAEIESQIKNLELEIFKISNDLPNLIDPSVGDEQIVDSYINLPSEDAEFFSSLPTTQQQEEYLSSKYSSSNLDHKTIGENFNILDFKTAVKISGTSWYFLINDGALLEQALIQYVTKEARKLNFSFVIPPSIVRSEITNACGFRPRDQNNEQQIYELTNDNLCLTGTAEIPLASLNMNKILEKTQLPKKYVGVSRSYRAEAGARGKDPKGLYRVHEFTKVELFIYSTQENSNTELENLKNFQIKLIEKLGLFSRVLNMPTDDLGAPAYKKYDIEAWMPGRSKWGEITSTSNCTDYQSRRFNIKYNDIDKNGKKISKFAHTLNGTAVAIPRVILALIENNYDKNNNCIWIPEPLREYMDGRDRITPFEE
ncbi:putative serine--tRNA ligase DIA4 [Ascoidea rubescens DSM 1968]|uniref:serine--tRNA ligase n=1 Tax=Ascoidea rubescens DSM 1968 TaxID=1344418 RepID=A0A1D2VJZ6_9ASCO|nr:seryl-tRNA synthetase [Ascoidea rubescens DSM 1968]ODV61909.1 seryl-tRNA synthetase [Ascoidea rubescens DSM 1968]